MCLIVTGSVLISVRLQILRAFKSKTQVCISVLFTVHKILTLNAQSIQDPASPSLPVRLKGWIKPPEKILLIES